jgi:hypothetical protein
MSSTVLPLDTPSTYVATTTVPKFSGVRPYPFLTDPLNSALDPASTAAGQTEERRPYDTTGDRTTHTGPGRCHRPVINVIMAPQDGRQLPRHVATVPLRARAPSAFTIKGRVEGPLEEDGRRKKQRTTDQKAPTYFRDQHLKQYSAVLFL